MGFQKYGQGEVIPEEGEGQKTAAQQWTDEDQQALDKENEEA